MYKKNSVKRTSVLIFSYKFGHLQANIYYDALLPVC